MTTQEWDETVCRRYADGLRPMVRFDHGLWADRIVAAIGDAAEGAVLLDVATGPGFLAIEIGKRAPTLKLVALDQAQPMLAVAQQDARAAGLSLTAVCSSAEALHLDDETVDFVTCKQLLHEAKDPEATARECLRVLKPGGRFFLIDFDADGSRLTAFALRTLMRCTRGRQIAADFWRSFKAGLRGEDVEAMLASVGFADVRYRRTGFNYYITATRPFGS